MISSKLRLLQQSMVLPQLQYLMHSRPSANSVRPASGVGSRMVRTVANNDDDAISEMYFSHERLSDAEMIERSSEFYELMKQRRTIRAFSSDNVPLEVIENVIKTAGTAPSGANTEPWSYVVVADYKLKKEIRSIVEVQDERNYASRMGDDWIRDSQKFRASWMKLYLQEAPYVIAVFRQAFRFWPDGSPRENLYNEVSVAISVGILLAAIQNAGLVTLTSSPLHSGAAIRNILKRPPNEELLFLMPVGLPAQDATVSDVQRKDLSKIMHTFL